MVVRLEFGVLGPLLVSRDGIVVPIPAGMQRALLAFLLLNTDHAATANELIQALWEDDPPASARVSLQNHIRRLRNALGDRDHSLIITEPGGYRISVDTGALDVCQFEVLLSAARAAARAGSWDQAAADARTALTLWRGEPLADVASEALALHEVPRLTELRLQAEEVRLDADLELGMHNEVIPQLRRLVGMHPLRERLHAFLMLALYRCGRHAEALAAYEAACGVLAEELGAEPGIGLRRLHQRILADDLGLTRSEHRAPDTSIPAVAVPRMLPGTVHHFVGRQAELSFLTGLLKQADASAPGTVVITAIGGTAGVGKTALAVHWAHQMTDRFPDGQLYVNLRGYDAGQPIEAGDALAGFLRALGVPGREIPAEPEERAACYRSRLAGSRTLILLDNAASEEQVRPLLPATPGSMAVVTSRRTLSGLVAREGARSLEIDLLPLADAVALLCELIGEQADSDRAAARTLAVQCSRLPLALRVAAERAARTGTRLADLVAEQEDEARRLDLLQAGGDPRTAVRAVFSWSYRDLNPDAARAFRLASLHPGQDLDSYAAAALTNETPEHSGDMLQALGRTHLMQLTRPGRYAMHDLLRAYSRELGAAEHSQDEQTAALTRLFDYYLHGAIAAMDVLAPAERDRRPRITGPATEIPTFADPAAAQAWLDTERACLVASVAQASANGWCGHATRLSATLFRYLDSGGHYAEAYAVYSHALDAARRVGDGASEAEALTSLGVVDARQGRFQRASNRLQQAVRRSRDAADPAGEARALSNLGYVEFQQGRYEQATDSLLRSLALHQAAADLDGEARALSNLAFIDVDRGLYEQAAEHYHRAMQLFSRSGNGTGEAHALANLGEVDLRRGRHEQAAGYLTRALALHRAANNRAGAAYALTNLGCIDVRRGRHEQALRHHRESLAIYHQTGDRNGESAALNGLGEAFLALGQPSDARTYHSAALDLAEQTGSVYEKARAHDGLGRAHDALGDPAEARRQWRSALACYTRLRMPEADQIRARLAAGR